MSRIAVLLMGPTGAGKSDLALELNARLPLEIISVDSALIYRDMDIGTAKPTRLIRERVPHHLIDIRDPAQSYSAGEFVRDATQVMNDIWARGRQPLLVGGTMLYFHALSTGIAQLPHADAAIRAAIEVQAAREGWPALHAELARVDPAAGARIHGNDPQRIQRALEVYRISGQPISLLQQAARSALGGIEVIEVALAPAQRQNLHANIERRFERMMADGLLAEVLSLYRRGDLTLSKPSVRAVGYRQIWQHLQGDYSLASARERAIIATRQLAKRQMTWLRRRQCATWYDAMHPELARTVISALSKRIENSGLS